jgi:hypothetical protein
MFLHGDRIERPKKNPRMAPSIVDHTDIIKKENLQIHHMYVSRKKSTRRRKTNVAIDT